MKICRKRTILSIVSCIGGMLIHLVIGSLYQWGIVNIYITSYYKMQDPSVTLQQNAVAFPIMMISIGVTIKLGLFLAEKIHPLIIMGSAVVGQSAVIFASSYAPNMTAFIIIYGVLFGLCSGFNFMLPIYECNKFIPHKKMYVNGTILIGTGLGSLVFGLFSYNFLNPQKLPPRQGYYSGSQQLLAIAAKVPECIRWLSLLYLIIGSVGVLMISYACIDNHKIKKKHKYHPHQHAHVHDQRYPKPKNFNQPNIDLTKISKQQRKATNLDGNIKPNHNLAAINTNNQSTQILYQKSKPTEVNNQIQPTQLNKKKEIGLQKEQQINNIGNGAQVNGQNIQQSGSKHSKSEQDQEQDEDERERQKEQQQQELTPHPTTLKEAFCSKVWWIQVAIIFFGSCGLLLMNGNYKTYVKKTISDDQFLTIIGVIGSLANGFSRFVWNLMINCTGYKFIMVLNLSIQLVLFSTIRFVIFSPGLFMLYIFLSNFCIGGFLGTTTTLLQLVFGVKVGSAAYGVFWFVFSTSNFIQYIFVSSVASKITFDGIIYICLGMSVVALLFVIFGNFQAPWRNCPKYLGYCVRFNKSEEAVQQNKDTQKIQVKKSGKQIKDDKLQNNEIINGQANKNIGQLNESGKGLVVRM